MATTNRDQQGKGLALALADAFFAFGPAYVKWIKSCLPEDYLTHARIQLLNALHCFGPQIMSDLSEKLGVSPRNVTTLVDGLERDGLVRRRPHPTDRRATFIELTPWGAEGCANMYTEYAGAVSELFSELSEGDQRELLRLIQVLCSALQRKGIVGERM